MNTCDDNRFELIEKYKKKLIDSTNIETSADEMKVLDELLFRFWQLGWLDKLEQTTVEQYRERMIQAFHNADCDELIALVVQPAETEFEHLEWLLKTHYKKNK